MDTLLQNMTTRWVSNTVHDFVACGTIFCVYSRLKSIYKQFDNFLILFSLLQGAVGMFLDTRFYMI